MAMKEKNERESEREMYGGLKIFMAGQGSIHCPDNVQSHLIHHTHLASLQTRQKTIDYRLKQINHHC